MTYKRMFLSKHSEIISKKGKNALNMDAKYTRMWSYCTNQLSGNQDLKGGIVDLILVVQSAYPNVRSDN